MFMCCVLNPRNINIFVQVPKRIGDWGDREFVYVPNVYVPFLAPNYQKTTNIDAQAKAEATKNPRRTHEKST